MFTLLVAALLVRTRLLQSVPPTLTPLETSLLCIHTVVSWFTYITVKCG